MLFRSLRSLAGRALAAGAASALTLTLFNAAQPTLTTHKVQPGTLKNIKVTLTPAPSPITGPAAVGQQRSVRRGLWTTPRALHPGPLVSPSGGPSPGPGR